jgi:hypothetical protein
MLGVSSELTPACSIYASREEACPSKLPRLALGDESKCKGKSLSVKFSVRPEDNKPPDHLSQFGGTVLSQEIPERLVASAVVKRIPESVVEPAVAPVAKAEPEISPSVKVTFEVDGVERHLILRKRPLGAEFQTSFGILRVSKVLTKSYAWELGIQEGWIIKSVDNADVSDMKSQEAQKTIKSSLMVLPIAPSL